MHLKVHPTRLNQVPGVCVAISVQSASQCKAPNKYQEGPDVALSVILVAEGSGGHCTGWDESQHHNDLGQRVSTCPTVPSQKQRPQFLFSSVFLINTFHEQAFSDD